MNFAGLVQEISRIRELQRQERKQEPGQDTGLVDGPSQGKARGSITTSLHQHSFPARRNECVQVCWVWGFFGFCLMVGWFVGFFCLNPYLFTFEEKGSAITQSCCSSLSSVGAG